MANDLKSKRDQFMKSIRVDQKTQQKLAQTSKKAQFNSNNSSSNGNKGEARQRERSRGMER